MIQYVKVTRRFQPRAIIAEEARGVEDAEAVRIIEECYEDRRVV